jgi:hypothetical protein
MRKPQAARNEPDGRAWATASQADPLWLLTGSEDGAVYAYDLQTQQVCLIGWPCGEVRILIGLGPSCFAAKHC